MQCTCQNILTSLLFTSQTLFISLASAQRSICSLLAEMVQKLIRVFLHQQRSLISTFCLFVYYNQNQPMFLEKTKWWEVLFAKLELSTAHPAACACMRGRVYVALTVSFVVTA